MVCQPSPRRVPVLVDPRLHFAVEGFRGGDVGAERTRPLGQFFRKAALARSRAAEHQSDLPHGFTGGMRAMKCPRMRSGQSRNGTSPVPLSPWAWNQSRMASAWALLGSWSPVK